MRDAISNAMAGLARLLHERTVAVLTIMLLVGVVAVLWQVSRVQDELVESTALQHAALYSQALSEFRTLYTSEVVERVSGHKIEVTHELS